MGRLPAGAKPSYRHHKPSGKAVVTLQDRGGQKRDLYLGPYGSAESHESYAHWIGLWEDNGGMLPVESDSPPTISKLCNRFLYDHAVSYYVKDGKPTSQFRNHRWTATVLAEDHGDLLACEFDYGLLRDWCAKLAASGLARETVNDHCQRVVRIFTWGAQSRLVPVETVADLKLWQPLKRGRTLAPDNPPVTPIDDAEVERVVVHLKPIVKAMVRVQQLTGMRPGEVCRLRPIDLDRSDDECWIYEDGGHKTAHLGKRRVIGIGPRALAILRPLVDASPSPTSFIFPPPKRSPRFRAGLPMTENSYGEMIEAGWLKSRGVRVRDWKNPDLKPGIEARHGKPWRPNRIRHSAGTDVRRAHGIEAAQLVLGHGNLKTTEVYAERDVQRLKALVKLFG